MGKEIVAMILAGGRGTRLKELTAKVAKPAVHFGGKYRIIDFPLSNCANSGIDIVGVLTQYESVLLGTYVGAGTKWGLDGANSLAAILPARERDEVGATWYAGTADAIYQNLDFLDRYDPEYVLILSGDHIYNRDGVLKAKTEIFKYLKKDGHIVLNGDDDKLCTVKAYEGIKPVFFGMEADKDIYADEIVSRGLKGMTCRIHVGGESFVTDIPMPGRHMVYNALAATAVGRIYGLTLEQIRHGIETLEAISGRFHMIETDRFLIVDDCYNANPMSMKASLDVLKDGAGRRVAILGDMGELGENEVQLHAEVGEHAAQCGIDVCICTGALSANIAKEARKNPQLTVIEEPDRDSLLAHLDSYVKTGDTILVKASHFMQFEKVVAKLQEM